MKHCHLPSYNRVATLALAALITFVASTGWASKIEGNLEVKARSGADGDLTVEGATWPKGNTTLGNDGNETSGTTSF